MRVKGLHRTAVVLAIAMVVSGAALFSAGTAWAGQAQSAHLVLSFNDQAKQAQLRIRPQACPHATRKCVWMLFMNLPLLPGQPFVAEVKGTFDTISLPYPKFCGVIQADALRGPAPWTYRLGIREKIDNCHGSGHPSTTDPTTPDPPPTIGPPTSPNPPGVQTVAAATASTSGVSTTGSPSALPFSDSPSSTVSEPAAAQLPFTGMDPRPLLIFGVTLMALGSVLLSTVESRRRLLRRAAALRIDHVKDGARRTSSWFLGR
jgi:hypothetical protein